MKCPNTAPSCLAALSLLLLTTSCAGSFLMSSTSGYPVSVGSSFRDAPFAPKLEVLPAGAYMMGSTEAETTRENRAGGPAASEKPRHREVIEHPLAIGEYLVTVDEFNRFVKATHRMVFDGCQVDITGTWSLDPKRSYLDPAFTQGGRNPAVCVTWNDAEAYTQWLSAQTGHHYRLIAEREFEYAARAGTQTARWWGDSQADLCAHANGADQSFDRAYPGDKLSNKTCDDGFAATNPVDHFAPNPFGLYDMTGNAWEWMADCFRANYSPSTLSPDEATCQRRSIRGGSWHNYPNVLRSATRFALAPTMRASSTGFRVARDPDT
jgi:formylglycine-generating enzyme required for sulfatase activity